MRSNWHQCCDVPPRSPSGLKTYLPSCWLLADSPSPQLSLELLDEGIPLAQGHAPSISRWLPGTARGKGVKASSHALTLITFEWLFQHQISLWGRSRPAAGTASQPHFSLQSCPTHPFLSRDPVPRGLPHQPHMLIFVPGFAFWGTWSVTVDIGSRLRKQTLR